MISIIIPVYNQHEMTRECIESIRRHTMDFELILIDNGSDPPITKPYIGFERCTLIRNEKNEGFPFAINQGIEIAKLWNIGEKDPHVIIAMNNDIIVTPEWANHLLWHLNEYDIVGPMTNYCAGLQKITLPSYANEDELNKEAEFFYEDNRGRSIPVNWIIGFCMAMRKSLLEEVGMFDQSMWPCSGEEIDFCYRAGIKGYKVGIAHDVYIHHFGSKTFFDIMSIDEYNEINKRNDKHLAEKWGNDFWKKQGKDSSISPKGKCVNLGCGYRKLEGFENIDNRPEMEPDVVANILKGFPFYKDDSIDLVRADDFLEHIPSDKIFFVIDEIWRILKPGGKFESLTPDAECGQGAFQDPTHKSFWVENTWLYFSDEQYRKLYGTKANFTIESIESKQTAKNVYHLHVIAKKNADI